MVNKNQVVFSAFTSDEHIFLNLLKTFFSSGISAGFTREKGWWHPALAYCSTRCHSKIALWINFSSGMTSLLFFGEKNRRRVEQA